jgi:Fur family transcriptional regulator, ferric uptake regulator
METLPIKQRNTRTKEAVVQVLQSFAAPIALSELYEFIKMSLPKTAFSTIFRIVERLETEGKVIRIDWRERGSRYEWAELPHHHHIVCSECGSVVDISDDLLRFETSRVTQQTGFTVSHHSIELQGLCPKCQDQQAASS